MKAVVTVIGRDKVGIIAGVSRVLADNNANILDISQTILQEYFTMIMLVDVEHIKVPFNELQQMLNDLGEEMGLSIRIQHEDIFNSMHRI
jgi:ACT domain-containing protein